jgi:hypothetical protein
MSASVAYASATWGASSGIGQHYGVGRFDAEATVVPFQQGAAQTISYTVPADTRITSPTIIAMASRSWCASPGNAAQAGVARLRLNGADVAEWAVYETGWWEPTGGMAFKTEQRRGGGIHLFGCDFAPGDVLVLRFTGTSSTQCALINADLTGVSAGATVCETNRRTVSGNTATDCVTYTVPAGGFTMKRVCLTAQVRGNAAHPFLTLKINGQPVYETPTWRAVDSMGAPPRIVIPLWGVTLYPGDVVSLEGSSLWRMDESIHLTVAGRSDSLSGGYPSPAQVASAVWAKVLPGSASTPTSPPSADNYADAVWDEVIP